MNRDIFFIQLKPALFPRSPGPQQREGITAILDRWEALPAPKNLRHLAYMLATVHHETARTMQPIKERGGESYLRGMYDITGSRPALARANGNTERGDGARYAGRGFVQLTWKKNYKRASEQIGIDLVAAPDRALEMAVATHILFSGMAEGWFTGRKLSEFLNDLKTDWINARKTINGIDKAGLIANLAELYFKALAQSEDRKLALPPSRPSSSPKRTTITVSREKIAISSRPRRRFAQRVPGNR